MNTFGHINCVEKVWYCVWYRDYYYDRYSINMQTLKLGMSQNQIFTTLLSWQKNMITVLSTDIFVLINGLNVIL